MIEQRPLVPLELSVEDHIWLIEQTGRDRAVHTTFGSRCVLVADESNRWAHEAIQAHWASFFL